MTPLALKILTDAGYAAVFRASQALKSLLLCNFTFLPMTFLLKIVIL